MWRYLTPIVSVLVPVLTAAAEDTRPEADAAPAAAPVSTRERSDRRLLMRVMDVRVSLGGQSGPTEIHDDYRSGAQSQAATGRHDVGVDHRKAAGGISEVSFVMGHLHPCGGLLWGAGLRGTSHVITVLGASDPTTQKLKFGSFGIIGHVDYGYAFTPIWHAEVGPFASVGGSSGEWFDQDTVGTYRKDRLHGGYVQGGVRAGTYVAVWRHLVLGLNLEYGGTLTRLEGDHTTTNGHSKLLIHEHGLGALLSIGFRF